jgi:hypothetical protein
LAIESRVSKRFWRLFRKLPTEIQRLAEKNYNLWRASPSHPSLRFRRLQGTEDLFTIRIGDHYRAIGVVEADCITWVWIGTHSDYNRIISK